MLAAVAFLCGLLQDLDAVFFFHVLDVGGQLFHRVDQRRVVLGSTKIDRLVHSHPVAVILCHTATEVLMEQEVFSALGYQIEGVHAFVGCLTVNGCFHFQFLHFRVLAFALHLHLEGQKKQLNIFAKKFSTANLRGTNGLPSTGRNAIVYIAFSIPYCSKKRNKNESKMGKKLTKQ